MGLLDFNKPKWQHKDAAVRQEALKSIDPGETAILTGIVMEDPDQDVRRAAIERLVDLETITALANNSNNPENLPFITSRKEQLLYDIVLTAPDNSPVAKRLSEISSPDLLAKIATGAEQSAIRLAAINQIEDQFLLAEVIEQKCGKGPAQAALAKISDEKTLERLTNSAASKTARRLAAEKLADIEQQKHQPDESAIIDKALISLAAEAAELLGGANLDKARDRLDAIKEEWQKLDKGRFHPAHNEFSETLAAFAEKSLAIEQSRQLEQAKAARYEEQQAQFNEICTTIEALTCSTEDTAEDLRNKALAAWQKLVTAPIEERLVPSEAMKNRFDKTCSAFTRTRDKIKVEKELVADIEKKIREVTEQVTAGKLKKAALNIKDADKRLALAKLKYFSKPALEKLQAEVVSALTEAKNTAREQNVSRRQEICAALESLSETENYSQAEGQVSTLRQDWQGLEPLVGDDGDELEKRFKKALTGFTEKQKAFLHEKDWQSWANLSLKEKLIEQVETLDQEENLETVFNTVKELQVAWKEIGPVPRKKSQKIWDRFHNSCDRNFKRTAPYLEEMKKRREDALDRRREICLAAEELADSTAWTKTANALKTLQEEWKGLVHGSRREEEKLYKQFRETCDRFFSRRQEDYESRADDRLRNLTAREDICGEAEKLAEEPLHSHAGKLRSLQNDWKKIGPVPREKDKETWNRFRAACDKFFAWLDEEHLKNLKKKEELCKETEELLATSSDDSKDKEIATRLAELQQQWKEIGPVPHKQKEAIWLRFTGPCDAFFKARQQQFEKENEKRCENQTAKEEMLARAEELANLGTEKKTTTKLQALQKEWGKIGPAPREINSELNGQFKSLCDAFFEGRRQYFSDLADQRLENQKKKESLCLRLENIIGMATGATIQGRGTALSLAETLKQAMQDNIMLAGRRNEKSSVQGEVKRIEQEWEKIGAAARDQERQLVERFRKALNSYYQKHKKN